MSVTHIESLCELLAMLLIASVATGALVLAGYALRGVISV